MNDKYYKVNNYLYNKLGDFLGDLEERFFSMDTLRNKIYYDINGKIEKDVDYGLLWELQSKLEPVSEFNSKIDGSNLNFSIRRVRRPFF